VHPRVSLGAWKARKSTLALGETVEWEELIGTIRFAQQPKLPDDLRIRFYIFSGGADPVTGRALYVFSNPITLKFQDLPTNNLTAALLAAGWQVGMSFSYKEDRGLLGLRQFQVDADGMARLVNHVLPSEGPRGTYSLLLTREQLNRLAVLLHEHHVCDFSKMQEPVDLPPAPDEGSTTLSLVSGGNSLVVQIRGREFALHPEMQRFQNAMESFVAEVAVTATQGPDRASDETYRSWLAGSELVVVGILSANPIGILDDSGVVNYVCTLKVAEAFKGSVAPGETIAATVQRMGRGNPPEFNQGDEIILFLKRAGRGGKPDWHTADIWYGAQRFDARLSTALWRLAAATPGTAQPTPTPTRAGSSPQTLREILADRSAPQLDTLAQRSIPSASGEGTTEAFDLLKLRDTRNPQAVPALEAVLATNARTSRIHGFAAAQALFMIGTPQANAALRKYLLTQELFRPEQGFRYAFHWDMPEPQRSQFIDKYVLQNLSAELRVTVRQSEGQTTNQLNFTVAVQNTSSKPLSILDHQVYVAELLYLRSADGRYARRTQTVDYSPPMPKWITLAPAQQNQWAVTLTKRMTNAPSGKTQWVLESHDVRFELPEGTTQFSAQAMMAAAPLTPEALKALATRDPAVSNVWSGRAVSQPVSLTLAAVSGNAESVTQTAATASPPTNALRSRVVFERTVFKQGEPIEVRCS